MSRRKNGRQDRTRVWVSKNITEEFQVDLKNWSQWLTIFNCREVTELCDRLQQTTNKPLWQTDVLLLQVNHQCTYADTPKTNREAQLHFEFNKGKEGDYPCRGSELEGLQLFLNYWNNKTQGGNKDGGIVLREEWDERWKMTVYNRRNFFFLLLNKETDEQKNNTCVESWEIKKRLLRVTACLCQAA